jgi:DNA-binding CsgD family transcriptional regulator
MQEVDIAPRQTLTSTEVRIADLVAYGLPNREIAKIHGTTEFVVKNYVRNILDKTGFDGRLQLAVWWLQTGWKLYPQHFCPVHKPAENVTRTVTGYASVIGFSDSVKHTSAHVA